jgi:hypothetical protein
MLNFAIMNTTLIFAARIVPRSFETKGSRSKRRAIGALHWSPRRKLFAGRQLPGNAVPLAIVPIFWTQVHLDRICRAAILKRWRTRY